MFSKYKSFDIIYILIFIANILFFYILTDYRSVAKPMIMASLLSFYIFNVRNQSPLLLLAMIFALFGDIFLLFNADVFFMMGLVSFALMQFLYIIYFLQDKDSMPSSNKYIFILSIFIIGVLTMSFLWPHLGGMKWPVIVYTTLLCLMAVTAVLRKKHSLYYYWIISGAILFMISDTLLAINKFAFTFWGQQEGVIITYMAAQFLIIRGIVAEQKV